MLATSENLLKPLTFLNITQFLGAFNDNLFKFGLVFFLIDLEGVEKSHQILSLSSALFVLPFILFGAPAGQLADKISKSRLIILTKILELLVMTLAFFSIYHHYKWLSFALLFLMASHSALFGPSKYGIIPELVPKEKISEANGIITGSTFLAIISGSGAASLILDITGNNTTFLMFCTLIISTLGIIASLFIPYTKPAKKGGTFNLFFWKAALHSLREMERKQPLLIVVLGSVYFLFIASFVQLNMIPFAHDILYLNSLDGGYLVFLTSLGIAIGAYIVGLASKNRVRLDFVPISCFLFGAVLILLDLFSSNLWIVLFLLPLGGFFGGFYVVPLDAYLQMASPQEKRGVYIGTASFLAFCGVLLSSLLIYILKEAGISPDQSFSLMGALTCSLSLILFFTRVLDKK